MKELELNQRTLRDQVSGSLRWTQSIFGPTAWVLSDVPPRATIASAP